MPRQRLSYVSVVFESEFDLLALQARSMARYLPRDAIDQIVVIDNSTRGYPRSALAHLLAEYADLAPLVNVLRPANICTVPSTTGWRSQQILKLAVAERLRGDRYVVLDAKNHLVTEPEDRFFEAPDGRARVPAYGYLTHPLRPDLERVLDYLGLDPAGLIDRFPATVTPFVVDAEIVRDMMHRLEEVSGRPFAQEFVRRQLTEFFLYSGWIVKTRGSLESVLDLSGLSCPIVWPHTADISGVREAVRIARDRRTPVFSVHRTALAKLDASAAELLTSFWTESRLFDSEAHAREFITSFRRRHRANRWRRRARELPHRVRRVVSR